MRKDFAAAILAIVGLIPALAYISSSQATESQASDDTHKTIQDIEAVVQNAMESLKKNDLSGMFEVFQSKLIWKSDDFSRTKDQCVVQRDWLQSRYGKTINDVELVSREEVGQSLVRFIYLEKLERYAIVWRLTFYRTSEGWQLATLSWDDNLQSLFKPLR